MNFGIVWNDLMGGGQSRAYRPEVYKEHSSDAQYEAWRASLSHSYMQQVKRNSIYYVRAAFVARDD